MYGFLSATSAKCRHTWSCPTPPCDGTTRSAIQCEAWPTSAHAHLRSTQDAVFASRFAPRVLHFSAFHVCMWLKNTLILPDSLASPAVLRMKTICWKGHICPLQQIFILKVLILYEPVDIICLFSLYLSLSLSPLGVWDTGEAWWTQSEFSSWSIELMKLSITVLNWLLWM